MEMRPVLPKEISKKINQNKKNYGMMLRSQTAWLLGDIIA